MEKTKFEKNKGHPKSEVNKKCFTCENFDKVNVLCKENKNCYDTNFSKCNSYMIKDTLINF